MEATAVSEPPQATPQEQKQEPIFVPQNNRFKGFMQRVFSILGLNRPDVPRSAEEILQEKPNLTQGNQMPKGWLDEYPKKQPL